MNDIFKFCETFCDEDYFAEIRPNVWLMNDHKWAFFAWENFFEFKPTKNEYVLIHCDYHWDSINDFHGRNFENIYSNINNKDELKSFINKNIFIRKDSFIAPGVIRGFF